MHTFSLVSPANKSTGIDPQPTFIWEPCSGADNYTVVIAKDSLFINSVITITGVKSPGFVLPEKLDEGYLYYWKIIATNKENKQNATNSGIWFRVKNPPLLPIPGVSCYYVSPTGEDNPGRGTIENPFRTLAYAATMVPPDTGDSIILSPGIFKETEPAMIPTGVNVIGAGESETILSSRGVSIPPDVDASDKNFILYYDGSLIQLVSPHNLLFRNTKSTVIPPAKGNQTIANFTIDGNDKQLKAGVWVENRNNVNMHNVTFLNLRERGAVFGPGDKEWYTYPPYYMKNIMIHDCTFKNSGKDFSDETTGNLNIAQLDSSEIYNIKINDNEGYGIKFIYDGYFKNLIIHDCNISVSESDPLWGEDISIELWNIGPGNEIYNIICNTWFSLVNHPEMFGNPTGTENMKVHDVRMIDNDGISNIEALELGAPGIEIYDSYFENKGFGIAIWDMGRSNILVHHNIIRNSTLHNNWTGGSSIYIDNSRDWDFNNILIYNNIIDLCNIGVNIKGNLIQKVDIKNNVFLNTSVSDVKSSAISTNFDHNLKYDGKNDWLLSGSFSPADNIVQVPGFRNTGNRWEEYYKPASAGSAVVDKGIYVGFPFNGSAPDIGRWEY